jgi:hypothetical protein
MNATMFYEDKQQLNLICGDDDETVFCGNLKGEPREPTYCMI